MLSDREFLEAIGFKVIPMSHSGAGHIQYKLIFPDGSSLLVGFLREILDIEFLIKHAVPALLGIGYFIEIVLDGENDRVTVLKGSPDCYTESVIIPFSEMYNKPALALLIAIGKVFEKNKSPIEKVSER